VSEQRTARLETLLRLAREMRASQRAWYESPKCARDRSALGRAIELEHLLDTQIDLLDEGQLALFGSEPSEPLCGSAIHA